MIWLLIALPVGTLLLGLINLLFWPRGRTDAERSRSISVLIPARDEADNIEAAVSAARGADEILVYDDGSTDATPEILRRLSAHHPQLRVLEGGALPAGWNGKSHACHRLAEAATSEILLFVDADTRLRPGALTRIAGLLEDRSAQMLTAFPRQQTGGLVEGLVIPLLDLTYVSWLLLPLIWRSKDVRFLAANGQVLAITRATYEATGGYGAVRHEVVDDMALARHVKGSGARVLFADGHQIADCRMYRGAREVFDGFAKNLYPGIGGHPAALAVVLTLYLFAFLVPWMLLLPEATRLVGLVGVTANLTLRLAIVLRRGYPLWTAAGHPFSIIIFVLIAVRSAIWTHAGRVQWRGRVYQPRAGRIS